MRYKTFSTGAWRPNASPAKRYTLGDYVRDRTDGQKYRKSGKLRSTTKDLCDFCLKVIIIKKTALTLRTKGWKFACRQCDSIKKFDLKKDKIWLEFTFQS